MAVKSSYAATAHEIRDLFSDYIEGDGDRPALAIGARLPSAATRNALEKSLEAFGYDAGACTYVSLEPSGANGESGNAALDAQALFLLIEGLDPLFVIATDATATAALAQAYRTTFPTDAPIRVFGRPAAAFENLDSLLETPTGKQVAWRALKTLQA